MASTEFQCIILDILKSLCDERADVHGRKTEKKTSTHLNGIKNRQHREHW